jgi:guanylate kinase
MGKSASGKDTVYKEMQGYFPMLKNVVLYTTRPQRYGEIGGKEYHFITDEQMDEFIDSGKVLELRAYHTVQGIWKYATIDDGQIDLNNYSYLMIGTLESYEKLRERLGAGNLMPIYIEISDLDRLLRALEREKEQKDPDYREVCRRFLADENDFSKEKLQNLEISRKFDNTNYELCIRDVKNYIESFIS